MSGLQIVDVSGTHFEIGFKIGQETKNEIIKVLDRTVYVNLEETTVFTDAYARLLNFALELYPGYIEELKGMAEGAGVSFRRLVKLNFPELKKLVVPSVENQGYDACTTLVLKKNNHVLIAHNEDGPSNANIFLVKGKLPSGVSILSLCYYGVLMGIAVTINSNGLFISCNSLTCKDESVGIPKRFIVRSSIESSSLSEFVEKVTPNHRAGGQNYLVCLNNSVNNIEVAKNDYEIHEIKGKFAHANNYILSSMIKYEGKTDLSTGSFLRSKLSAGLIQNSNDFTDLKNILSSHENRPSCICAHGKKEGDINLTLGYVFFDSNHKGKLLIGKGLTCQAKLNEYIIDGI